MMNAEIKAMTEKLPYISKENTSTDVYARFMNLKEAVKAQKEGLLPILTGIWYLTDAFEDTNAPQILYRTSRKINSAERFALENEIFTFIRHDVSFDYDEDLIKDKDVILSGIREMLIERIKEGKLLAVYDIEREG